MRNKTMKKRKSRDPTPWYKNPTYMTPIIVAIIGALGGAIAILPDLIRPGPVPTPEPEPIPTLQLQFSTVQGTVTDAQRIPLAGVAVEIDELSTTTDDSGVYTINNVSVGTKIITFRFPGAEDVKHTVTISKGGEIKIVDIALSTVTKDKPDIQVAVTIPQGRLVPFGTKFNIIVVVSNSGSGPAQNLHLFARANPSGYLAILDCDHHFSPLVPAGINITVGDLYPGANTEIHLTLIAYDISGINAASIEYDFTYSYYGADLERYAANTVFSLGNFPAVINPLKKGD